MKKMSEVFELPIKTPTWSVDNVLDASGKSVASFKRGDYAESAAHAINHADALADALESIVSDYNQYRAVNGIDLTNDHCAKLDVKMAAAEAALAAYRGEA